MTCSNCGKDDCLGYDDCSRSALQAECAELRAWQEAVAEGTGYINRPEGQGGYAVADPDTIVAAFKEHEREADHLRDQVTLAQRALGKGGDDEQWRPGETAVAALCRHYEELQFIKAEYAKTNASDLTRDALAMQNAVLKAKIETLREALQQVIVDINDPHPRNGTLSGFMGSLRATQHMVAGVLEETG